MARPLHNEKFTALSGVLQTYNDTLGGHADYTMVTVEFGAATSAGTLLIEAANSPSYGGTWATLATIAWAAADTIKTGLVTGPWKALRLRWSISVANGPANVDIQIGKSG